MRCLLIFPLILLMISACAETKTVYPFGFVNEVFNDENPIMEHCGRSKYQSKHRSWHGIRKRIVGGQESDQGEWPWLVTLMLSQNNGSTFEHLCGGTLIHPQWVLSASHCFEKFWAPFLTDDPAAWMVRIGEHNMFDDKEKHVDVKPAKIFLHPDRDVPRTVNLDIALLKLEHPVALDSHVNVACLPSKTDHVPAGSTCVTAGWGHTQEAGNVSNVVRHVRVPVIPNQLCDELYGSLPDAGSILRISDDMMCAGLETGGKDACQYDSGGPMVCYDNEDDQWLLIGVVSTGYGCARPGFPGIYTRVNKFLSWIEDVVGKHW